MDCLLSFDKNTRRVWMFPRNIRRIEPWKLHQILKVLMEYSDSDTSDQNTQDLLYNILSEIGVKRKGNTRDPNPGGMRTYISQLRSLGLIYKTKENSYATTIAGQNILEANSPQRVLQVALLRHQYPSSYGLGQNVRIDPRLKIKPFLFILNLLHDSRLEGKITSYEIQIPVIYGHNIDCFEFCVEKILELRNGLRLEEVVCDIEHDLYTPRGSNKLQLALKNVSDIANTAKNYLHAAGLIFPDYKSIGKNQAYKFNTAFSKVYENALSEQDAFIGNPGNEVSFQRAYGRYDKEKDTRSDEAVRVEPRNGAESLIQVKCISYMKDFPFRGDFAADFVKTMVAFGFSEIDVLDAIEPLLDKKNQVEEDAYLEYANSGGVYAKEFEQATTELFKELGFADSQWIGNRRSKIDRWGGFPDIFIKRSAENECGFADTKATVSYTLSHKDILALKETYLKSHKEIDPNSSLAYFIYVAGGFSNGTSQRLDKLNTETEIPITAITARALLILRKTQKFEFSDRSIEAKIFKSGKLIDKNILY